MPDAAHSSADQRQSIELGWTAREAACQLRDSDGGGLMSRTGRLREELRVYLEEHDTANIEEKLDHRLGRIRRGATKKQVGNVRAEGR